MFRVEHAHHIITYTTTYKIKMKSPLKKFALQNIVKTKIEVDFMKIRVDAVKIIFQLFYYSQWNTIKICIQF